MAKEFQYQWTDNPTVSGVAECNTDILNDCLMHLKYDKKEGSGLGLQLFDLIEKDHILTYEESKGLALLGSYVYKDAVAGSRYGYPDFYNKVVAEKEAGVATETTLGENTVTMYVNPNGHISYDIADKEAVDAWYDTYGIAWFYGVDTINERICLPRGQNYLAQGNNNAVPVDIFGNGNALGITTDLSKDGYSYQNNSSGSGLYPKTYTNSTTPPVVGASAGSGDQTGTSKFAGITTDPTKSGLVGTVDLSDIGHKAYIYMCVGNTEVSEAVTNVTDVTTTENDTIPLFTGMYFDFTPNNVSWLKAGEQKNSGDVYEFCYNELVNELTSPKYGLKVIETADMQDGVDYSEYWKVDQNAMTFTTPTAISNKALSGAVVGNGKTLGLTDGTANAGIRIMTTDGKTLVGASANIYGADIGTKSSAGGLTNEIAIGVVTDPATSGLIAEQSTAQLYFKVANAVQNLELLDAGYILENMVDKQNMSAVSVCIEEYVNDTSWYRIYSDIGNGKWCEQGGVGGSTSSATESTITFLKPFANNTYSLTGAALEPESAKGIWKVGFYDRTPTQFSAGLSDDASLNKGTFTWEAKGYLA